MICWWIQLLETLKLLEMLLLNNTQVPLTDHHFINSIENGMIHVDVETSAVSELTGLLWKLIISQIYVSFTFLDSNVS